MSAHRSHRARTSKHASRSPRPLRCEQLESRTLLSAISPLGNLYPSAYSPVGEIGGNAKTPAATPPTVVKAASANLNSAGTAAALSVLGNDALGASNLVYAWTVTNAPAGGFAKFSVNGTNAAQNDIVAFSEAGVYGIMVTIIDRAGLSVTSSVKVSVAQTLTSISLYSGTNKALVNSNTQLKTTSSSQILSAMGVDQFGYPMVSQPSFAWAVSLYPGGAQPSLTAASGLETVKFNKAGTYVVTASAVGANNVQVRGLANILVVAEPFGFAISQVGGAAAVLGTSAQFSVGQIFDQFQYALSEATTLTWSATGAPAGVAAPKFSGGATTTVTFSGAGTYVLTAKETDASGNAAVESITVTVKQTLTGISLYSGSNKALVNSNTQLKTTASSQILSAMGVDQFGHPMVAQPAFTWAVSLYPGGASPSLAAAGLETVTFNEAGTYVVTASAGGAGSTQVSAQANILVVAKPFAFAISQVGGAAAVLGTSAQFSVGQIFDQFQSALSETTTLTWSATGAPAGVAAPQFSGGATTTVTFSGAGTYVLTAKETDASGNAAVESITVTVKQTLASIVVTPGTASIQGGATQQFSAQGFDQFKRAMATQPTFTWSAGSGTISSAGLYTAPSTAGAYTVTAGNGSIAGSAKVTVTAPTPSPNPAPPPSPSPAPGGLQDPVLAALVQELDADGSLNRADMIQILTSVGASGTVSATDFADLKTILADAAQYNMPNYVQVLAGDVVNGNPANAQYQGAALGNLAAGSSAAQLDKLIDKWFYGTDLPALTSSSLTYTTVSGSLFPHTPSSNDEYQGELGDCYFISSLGTIANTNPAAIENMFINNGDGTYTVRFYGGTYGAFYNSNGTVSDGFASGSGTADYVTVNLSLPTYDGMLVYADYGCNASSPANSLWIPLAEKAYAEWNATGNEGRDGTNTYNGIQGGWMATVDAQVLGHNATDYGLSASTEQAMINALSANQAVTIATDASSNSADTLSYGLYGSHAYAVLGYNASSGLFTLYNPWGCDQPSGLSWSQLESTCEGFVTAVTTGSVPISSGNLSSPAAAAGHDHEYMVPATVPATPAATGDTQENRQSSLFFERATLNDSNTESSGKLPAAGVDAVLANQDLGGFFVG